MILDTRRIYAHKSVILQTYVLLMVMLALSFGIIAKMRDYPDVATKFCKLSSKIIIMVFVILAMIAFYFLREWLGPVGQTICLILIALLISITMQCFTGLFDWNEVKRIYLVALLVFVATTIIGFVTILLGFNLGWMGLILLAVLVALIVVGVLFWFFPPSKKLLKAYYIVGVLLFSIYVIYDTNVMVTHPYSTAPENALSFFLNFINMFMNLLGAFSD